MHSCICCAGALNNRSKRIYEQWILINDLIGPCQQWLFRIRKLFWTKFIINFEKFLICTFKFINGLDPSNFLEWNQTMELLCDNAATLPCYLFI